MDSKQEEKWKAAALPGILGVLDGYEFREPGKSEAQRRLRESGAPEWVIQLRQHLIERTATSHLAFAATFAIPIEVALAGMRCLYPERTERLATYRRILVHFLYQALRPVVERVNSTGSSNTLHEEYETLLQLYRFCENESRTLDPKRWVGALDRFERLAVAHHPRTRADFLTTWCLHPAKKDDALEPGLVNRFMFQLGNEYAYCYGEGDLYTMRIAEALLLALEKECAVPEWLPKDSLGQ